MGYYGSCSCGQINRCTCGTRHSIDNVTGMPLYIEDFVIPVFKGSTLITDFRFPFALTGDHVITVIYGDPEELEDCDIQVINGNTVSIKWDSDIISELNDLSNNTFRVRVENIVTGIVKVYNEIKIQIF